ncbi:hypothetical protein ILP92_15400 [Maribius pontilimi]|uniref:Uncharacterized protein n=1 Tax=Palleronia pontilimi TaxID=1964209 RepID=A0A934IEG3_9RHOB|nr:hypothetical protein [Palleronia pontilimi]MBJ3764136.1 hypothetical protein [Palleronia pontilimi]
MLGLLVLAGLATASVLPDMLSTKVDADAPDADATGDQADGGGEGNILDTLEPADPAAALPFEASSSVGGDLLSFDAIAGAHIIEDFDAELDRLVVNLPADSEGLDVVPADPETGTPPTISWEQEDGLVELQFDALDDVPVDRIAMQFDGLDYEVALSELIEAQNNAFGGPDATAALAPTEDDPIFEQDALAPTDPELPSEPAPGGAPDDDALLPTDPEMPDAPEAPPTDAPDDGSLATIVADPDILPDGPDIRDDTPPIEIIRDFSPGEDVLVLEGDPGSSVMTMAAPDGSGTHVFVDDQLVATVMGVSEIDPDDIVFAPSEDAMAA